MQVKKEMHVGGDKEREKEMCSIGSKLEDTQE